MERLKNYKTLSYPEIDKERGFEEILNSPIYRNYVISSDGKTSALAKTVKNLGWKRALIIDGATVNEDFLKASRNIEGLDILPTMGANVFDILKRDTLVITKSGIEALEARLK